MSIVSYIILGCIFIHGDVMMGKVDEFYVAVGEAVTVALATAADGVVSMRVVSPVLYDGGILFFTAADSRKYRQLAANPVCCVSVGPFFAEATAEFLHGCMLPENGVLRDAYCAKFPDAFADGVAFGGRGSEFVLLHPTRLSGWAFPDDVPTAEGIPTVPFDIAIES